MTTTTATFDKGLKLTKLARVDWYPFGFRVDKLYYIDWSARGKFLLRSGKVLFRVDISDDRIDVDLLNDVGGRKADLFLGNNFPLNRFCKRLIAGKRRYGFSLGDIDRLRVLISDFLKTLK